ncbi:MAG: biopolymer transporter ExbD [Bacteroidaceae bacterium]|nr:biopolymer transporter ExbD [Bacteroidaceae bacterium]
MSTKSGKSKQKKMQVRVDFTPMVDMNMLLITFFMLCTTLSKPQTMEISMPAKDDDKIQEKDRSQVKESEAVTVLLDGNDKVYYYTGQLNADTKLVETTYFADGLRAFLLGKNQKAVLQVRELKAQRRNMLDNEKAKTEAEFKKKVSEIKNAKGTPTVIIKATDEASYANLVDVLDEMQICSIGKYVIAEIDKADKDLIANHK